MEGGGLLGGGEQGTVEDVTLIACGPPGRERLWAREGGGCGPPIVDLGAHRGPACLSRLGSIVQADLESGTP